MAFGHQREHIQFEFFIREEKAIPSDWRDSQLVKPLDVISPPIEPRRSSKPLTTGNAQEQGASLYPARI